MKKFLSAALAVVMAATSTIALTSSAEARNRDRYDRHYHYDNYRYRHRHNNNDELAAGIVGFALGAIVAGTAQRNYARRDYYYSRDPGWDHIRRCESRYRSYDRYSDTFVGRDGRRYYCNL